MNKTNIEYLNYTWNPIAMRCTKVSEGCANCWHLGMAKRHSHNPKFDMYTRDAYSGKGHMLRFHELDSPKKIKRPLRIGVQFMGDLFLEHIQPLTIKLILNVIEQCPHHTFLILTKRPKRALDLLNGNSMFVENPNSDEGWKFKAPKNLWLGVTAENQARADERIPILLQIPAAVRFVSIEPMLGPVDFAFIPNFYSYGEGQRWYDPIKRLAWYADMSGYYDGCHCREGIDWVICGSESGPGRRPFDMAWARSIKDQCGSEGVPFFFKQGEVNGKLVKMPELDGQVWDQYPGVKP